MNIKTRQNLVYLAAFFALLFWGLSLLVWFNARSSRTEVVFLDIGQGDSILIKTRRQQYILIDAGPAGPILDRLGRNLPFYVRRLDLVVATHPDADHIGGLPQVLRQYEVGQILEPGVEHSSSVYAAWGQAMAEKKIEPRFVQSRLAYDLGDNAVLDVLYPDSSFVGQNIADNNDASIVVKFTDGNIDFLLTGDAPAKVEQKLVSAYGDYLTSEILKIGHHGSKTSSAEEFLTAVAPEVGVIQVGANNRYGHPSGEVLRRLQKHNIFVLRTDARGDIKLGSDGERVTLVE